MKDFKPVVYIGGAVLMAWLIKKWFFNKGKTSEAGTTNILSDNDKEINKYKKIYTQSYDDSNYESIANAIYTSIRYSGLDDNYTDTFNELLKVKNPLDLSLLIKAYGTRQRYKFFIPDGEPETLIPSVSKELRSEIIVNPFVDSKITQINDVWGKRGITTKL